MKRETFCVTTPIYYVNGSPHLGHLYTTVVADSLSRHHRQRGRDTFFLTGTDEHGRNVEKAAAAKGEPVERFVDGIAAQFQQLMPDFGLQPSRFIRTTDPAHKAGARHLFATLRDRGHIYKGMYEGWYCVGCNQFYTEKELESLGDHKLCPTHGQPLERIEEESYFFRLSAFTEPLLKLYREHAEFVRPESRLNEVIAFVSAGLEDLSISRTSVAWGIPVPGDETHTLYVWLDALANYVTALGFGNDRYDGLDQYWPANVQLVGKDILRFHAVYWPAFLMGAGLPLPKQIFAHGMWISGGRKMSKTLGNVIRLETLKRHFSSDAVRYFLLREKTFGDDADFNYPALLRRINGDLASGLGNLASRTLTLVKTSLDGVVPAAAQGGAGSDRLRAAALEARSAFEAGIERLDFGASFRAAWKLVSDVDQYLTETKPWALAKDPTRAPELREVLGNSAEVLRLLAVLLSPLQPESMRELWRQVGLDGSPETVDPGSVTWGSAPARRIGEVRPIYPRQNEDALLAQLRASGDHRDDLASEVASPPPCRAAPAAATAPVPPTPTPLSFEDFSKVDLRVGIVTRAEPVAGADKLLRLQVDVGEPVPRQVVAGIAHSYAPREVEGARVLVVANLAVRKVRGVESHGMILMTSDAGESRVTLVSPPEQAPAGARIR